MVEKDQGESWGLSTVLWARCLGPLSPARKSTGKVSKHQIMQLGRKGRDLSFPLSGTQDPIHLTGRQSQNKSPDDYWVQCYCPPRFNAFQRLTPAT